MATEVISKEHTTISIGTSGDTVTTRGRHVRVRNMGANVVSFSTDANPTAAVTAGSQSSLNPIAATGGADEAILRPNKLYYFRANTGAVLCCFDEVHAPGEFVQVD
jgi:hypothetical protein